MNPLDPHAPEYYRSVLRESFHEIIIEKSRFITYVCPVTDEESAKSFIDKIRSKHCEASHVVPAWIIGPAGLLMRASDDGEPQGTAGVPTLEVLRKEELTDVVVATVRYFGGIKLGAGGLIRAYTRAAVEGINAAGICEMTKQKQLTVTISYSDSGSVDHQLGQLGWLAEKSYTDQVHYVLSVPCDWEEPLLQLFANWTAGKASHTWGDTIYAPKQKFLADKDSM